MSVYKYLYHKATRVNKVTSAVKTSQKIMIVLLLIFLSSFMLMEFIRVGADEVGLAIAQHWCSVKGESHTDALTCLNALNSNRLAISQALSLSLFLFVIALTVIKMEWRVGAAILALIPLVIMGIVSPQDLISAVSWDLIFFLAGSMTLAGILKELGVFRYLALRVLELSKGNLYLLLVLIALMAFSLAATLDEVTSIVYVTMLILEICEVVKIDPAPLIILSVLATNTGSSALPIGNPIGVYLLFETGMNVSQFIRYALPLAITNLAVMLTALFLIERPILANMKEKFDESRERIEAYVTTLRIELSADREAEKKFKRMIVGLAIFTSFIFTVALNDIITKHLSATVGIDIDPHAFLSFVPYIYIVISLLVAVPLEEISGFVERSVEWPSLLFFMFLFMFGYMLTHTGVMAKLAYSLTHIGTSPLILLPVMLFSSATLSSTLDNLSVIVTFTPVAKIFNNVGLVGSIIYFALLFGGVFGGNYTPVGSTANIIAVSLAEKRKIKIRWGEWLRIALITTTLQLLVALLWLYLSSTF